jgi:RNA polymerase sigma factor (TIGR02999 family)
VSQVPSPEVTQLLTAWENGDQEAFERVMNVVYGELHRIASREIHRERPNHTLQATGLLHEAYLKLAGQRQARWHSRLHFFAVAARVMRRILVDYARERGSLKRGSRFRKVSLSSGLETWIDAPPELLEVDEALKRLEEVDPKLSRVVELRFFTGFTNAEIGDLLGVSVPTVVRRWRTARAWLYQYLSEGV